MDPQHVVQSSVCEVVSHPEKFDGMIIRVTAEYVHDGRHSRALVDLACPDVAIVPSELVRDVPALYPLFQAVMRNGCTNTFDKIITGKFTGRFFWDERNTPGTGKVPRWLELQSVSDLNIQPRPTGLICR
jgi:hypothetical protein